MLRNGGTQNTAHFYTIPPRILSPNFGDIGYYTKKPTIHRLKRKSRPYELPLRMA